MYCVFSVIYCTFWLLFSAKMPTYVEFIASEGFSAALKARTKAIRDVERYIRSVNKLSDKTPNPTAFIDLHKATNKAISYLDLLQSKCQELFNENCVEYGDGAAYIADLFAYDKALSEWYKILCAESERVQASILVEDDITQVQLEKLKYHFWYSEVDRNQFRGQMRAAFNSWTGPKPPTIPAPSFCTTGDHNDAKEYDKIPPNIQLALWQITGKMYPTLQEILENIKKAVDIVQMQFDKSSNVPKGKQVSESKVSSTVDCVNVSKSSKNSEPKFKRKYFCMYCESNTHISCLCPEEHTAYKRKCWIKIHKKDLYQECELCMRHFIGSKFCYIKGKCRDTCPEYGGKPHAKDLCPANLRKVQRFQSQPVTANCVSSPVLEQESVNSISTKS